LSGGLSVTLLYALNKMSNNPMSKNPTFKYSLNLPSLYVDKNLLENLEDYFYNKLPIILNQSNEIIREKYNIIIEDSNGEEKIGSIKEYILNTFPNDTKEITLSIYYWEKDESVSISIYFNKDKIGAKIKIEISNKSPKETTQGIVSSLNQIVNQNKNNNNLYHPSIFIDALISVIGLGSFWLSISLLVFGVQYSLFFLSLSIISFSYSYPLKKMKPYISFDSNNQRKYDRVTNWFFYGLLAFLIFSNVLVYLKNKLFG
jgi:hypothetical protein